MFVFAHHNQFLDDPSFLVIYQEFQYYKENSAANEHAAPSRHIQQTTEGYSPLFGRDRFDKVNFLARQENIQHLHVRQEHSIWEDEQGALVQWDCTSNSYLIYSYFFYQDKHHYFVIEFYANDAHVEYEHKVPYFVEQAKAYRLKIQDTAA